MSTKSLTFGLWGGMPKIASETKGAEKNRPTVLNHRSTIVLPRASSRRAVSHMNVRPLLSVGLCVAIAAMFLLYVFGINQYAAKGYEITKQKSKLNALIDQNKKLMVQAAEVGSIVQIQDEAAAAHLVQINSQEFLQTTQLTQR